MSLSSFSRDYQTGRDEGEGHELNMAARSMLRSAWTSLAGLKLGGRVTNLKVQQGINVPLLPALGLQSRGIRQGERRLGFDPPELTELTMANT